MTLLPGSHSAWRIPKFLIAVLLGSWVMFCVGAAFEYRLIAEHSSDPTSGNLPIVGFILLGSVAPVLLWILHGQRSRWRPTLLRMLNEHTDFIDALPAARRWLWIALAAGLGLYLELVIIRFHASCFQLFAFFKNVSLLSCFLGLGVGYSIAAREKPLLTPLVLPLLAIQLIFLHALRYAGVASVLQSPISEEWALGLEHATYAMDFATGYGFIIFIFAFNAICFVPLGHLASRLMARSPHLPAYSWNLVGSLAGILLFYILSFLWAPPAVWVGLAILMLFPFLRGHLRFSAVCAAVALAFLTTSFVINQHDIYSPYQILTVIDAKDSHPSVSVNHIYFQKIRDLRPSAVTADPSQIEASQYYELPYLIKPKPANVLIVGSGTGNDVASAVRHSAGHVDAVEIDPAILSLGRLMHPESPYDSDTVSAHVQDARAFIRYTPDKYDLIVYGLLDSHTVLSGTSGVRLDSYIYTVEAMREARAHLKPGGVICLSFCTIGGELGRKLYLMIQHAFDGKAPIVYNTKYDGACTFVIGEDLTALSGVSLPPEISPTDAFTGTYFQADESTDDWPFFYMPVKKYPLSYVGLIAILLIVASSFIWPLFAESGGGFSSPCFFLGAGFMLLETKAITELALYYGSTWVVIGIVITAILILAFLANLLLTAVGKFPPAIAYVLLLISLALSLALSGSNVSANIGAWGGRTLMTGVLTLPLFFAGLAFSSELKRAKSIGVALGSNLIGAMLGGCLEYNAMYFGYRSLYYLAIALYALAFATSILKKSSKIVEVNEPVTVNK